MDGFTHRKTADLAMSGKARRSTRILKPVRLKVVGENRVGSSQVELTSAVAVNCHGCLYTSRHEYAPGSWVTLEVSNQQINARTRSVRAQVRFVRLPGSPRELYCVGVELETPANVWGVKSAPRIGFRIPIQSVLRREPPGQFILPPTVGGLGESTFWRRSPAQLAPHLVRTVITQWTV
jgi:hypothetical protein